MCRVAVSGCNGHMGKLVAELIANTDDDIKVVCGVDACGESDEFPVFKTVEEMQEAGIEVDVIIDFSTPTLTERLLDYAEELKCPIVIATTGFDDEQVKHVKETAKKIPVFCSANMSYQIAMLKKILPQIYDMICKTGNIPDVEILDKHHNRKKDFPSGTSKMLAKTLEECHGITESVYGRKSKRQKGEIGISSQSGGNIVGTHVVDFYSENETFEITHIAHDRKVFASGAIDAAFFIISQKPGFYTMDDLF